MYIRSFLQLKFLCIVCLLFVHSMSFTNSFFATQIEFLGPSMLFGIPLAFHGLFLTIAGVSFRIFHKGYIENHRLTPSPPTTWAWYFFFLMIVEILKEYLLGNGFNYFLQWDFLKTIFAGLLLVHITAKIHIYATLLFFTVLTLFYQPLANFVASFIDLAVPSDFNPKRIGTYHYVIFSQWLFFYGLTLFAVFKKTKTTRLRTFLISVSTMFCLFIGSDIFRFQPSHVDYLYAKNWIPAALIGSIENTIRFPLLAWSQTVGFGYLACHFAIQYRQKITKEKIILIALLALVFMAWGLSEIYEKYGSVTLEKTWQAEPMSRSTLLGELLKLSFLVLGYGFFVMLNRLIKTTRADRFFMGFSLATFWIYILSTSWTPVFAKYLRDDGFSFRTTMTLTFTSSLFLSYLLARLTLWLNESSVKVKFKPR